MNKLETKLFRALDRMLSEVLQTGYEWSSQGAKAARTKRINTARKVLDEARQKQRKKK